MATNMVIVDGLTGGTNTNVLKVLTQTFDNSDATINAVTNRGYILTSSTLQTINLPTPCTVGDVFALHGNGVGLFKVAQRAGEQITLGDKTTTIGVTGFIDSTNSGDEIYLICTDASGKWKNDGGYGGTFLIDGVTPTNAINNVGGNGMLSLIDTQTFTADGTWTKPIGAAFVNVLIIGGGGGAGSGARSAETRRSGGVGGSYGAATYVSNYAASLLNATEAVTVGPGGIGGAAQTVNETDGNNGNSGVDSDFDKFSAHGGGGGDRGQVNVDTVTYTGVVASSTMISYLGAQIVGIEASTQAPPPEASFELGTDIFENAIGKLSPSSGGPGQVVKSGVLQIQKPGVALDYDYIAAARVQAAAAAPATIGNNGTVYELDFGSGASGGASTISSIGYDGGNGGDAGGGGGGGGTSGNGNVSGKGGNGGRGVVVVHTYG